MTVHYIDQPPGDPDWIKKVAEQRGRRDPVEGADTEDSPEGDTPAQ